MTTLFPVALDSLTNPQSTDKLGAPSHAAQHANANDAIEALEAKVGITNSVVAGSLDKRVSTIEGTLPSPVGTVTSLSVVSANGLGGTVASSTTTPAITLSTSITGLLKGNGTAISAASSSTDYQVPLVSATNIKSINGASILASGDLTLLTSLSGALLATGATTGGTSQAQEFTNGVTHGNVAIPTISSTSTLTNKRLTPRILSAASYTTDTGTSLNVDNIDSFIITAQAGALKFNNPSGTPTESQKLLVRIKDNATAHALTYDTQFRAIGTTLPATTVLSKTLYLGFIYNITDTKWDLVSTAQEV